MNKRLISFDLLKLFAIFLVLWGHCIQYFLSTHYSFDYLYRVIYSFHMPLFMMISGFFSVNSYRLSFKEISTKKFKELIKPVIVWGGIFFIGSAIIRIIDGAPIFPYYDLKAILYKNLWFLKSLFCCYIFAYFCFKNNKCNRFALLLTLLLSQFIVSHNICSMYPAFITGVFLNKHQGLLFNKRIMLLSLTIFILMLFQWDDSFWPIPDMFQVIETCNMITIYDYIYKSFFRVIIGIWGSIFFIILFNILFSKSSESIISFAKWGRYTLEVYILQSIFLETIAWKFINFDHVNIHLFHYVYAPLISFALLISLLYCANYTYCYPKLSYLLWGKTSQDMKLDRLFCRKHKE